MKACVSHDISSTTGSEIPILSGDVKQLLGKISNLCGKIHVAKVNLFASFVPLMLIMRSTPPKQKETSQLAELCDALRNCLSDRSLVSQQDNYDEIKKSVHYPPSIHLPLMRNDSYLAKVEKRLTSWSKYNYPKSFCTFGSLSPSS